MLSKHTRIQHEVLSVRPGCADGRHAGAGAVRAARLRPHQPREVRGLDLPVRPQRHRPHQEEAPPQEAGAARLSSSREGGPVQVAVEESRARPATRPPRTVINPAIARPAAPHHAPRHAPQPPERPLAT
ncbi:hypothetical protein FOCC_FOCC017730, partial [Frankliniella occidentalis]